MSLDNYNHFVCIVAGDNPEEMMKRYDKSIKVEPYVVWKKSDAEKIRQNLLTAYRESYKSGLLMDDEKDEVEETIKYMSNASPEQVFNDFTVEYMKDPKTGDAISNSNPDGRWSSYQIGKAYSIPFITKDGKESFSELKGNIDWSKIHLNGKEIYDRTWEMIMEGHNPENEYEEKIYENMKNRTTYFEKFGSKEMYTASNTAFWGYAFLSENTGWIELEEGDDQFAWMTSYYDIYIKNLPQDTKLTIFECRK